jgi:EmrB/QacA subfamily drug resistance transporter
MSPPEPPESAASSLAVRTDSKASSTRAAEVEGILVIVGIFFAILMGAMDALVVATVLPTIATDLHQVNGVAFVVSSYLVSSTIAIPIFGKLSDISSRRNVFLAGLVIFIIGSACAGFSQNLTELIIFRGVQGFGGGGIFPIAIAMVAVMYPPEARTRVTAALSASTGVAIVAGPLLGSYIVSVTTWRWVFYINLPFGIFAMAIILIALGPLRSTKGGKLDLPGALLISGWVATLMVALVQVSDSGWAWTDPRIVGLLAATLVLFAIFLVWELRVKDPLVPLRILKRRAIASASGVMLFTGVVFSALITFLSLYVGIVLGLSTGDIRDMIYFVAVPLIVGAGLAGAVLNKVPYRVVVSPALLISGVAGIFLGLITASTPLWSVVDVFLLTGGIALILIPVGAGLGLALSGVVVAVQNEAPTAEVGQAIGLTRFFQSLGGAVGISLLTVYLTTRFNTLKSGATTPSAILNALVTSYDEVFLILAVCILLAFVCSLWLTGRVPTGRAPPPSAPSVTGESMPGAEPAR